MARILAVLTVLAVGAGVAAAVLARGSQAAAHAAATIQRTFVSTSGSDANPCTPAQPCRSFAAAIANTTAGGEVVALDSGGYGPFTIDKSVTIAGAPGAHVAISVFSGNGIAVAADAADRVVLRNLFLTGLGGLTGISFQAGGSLHVESVVSSGFTGWGLDAQAAAGRLVVRDSVFRHNGVDGVRVLGSLRVAIVDSRADRNGSEGFLFAEAAPGEHRPLRRHRQRRRRLPLPGRGRVCRLRLGRRGERRRRERDRLRYAGDAQRRRAGRQRE